MTLRLIPALFLNNYPPSLKPRKVDDVIPPEHLHNKPPISVN